MSKKIREVECSDFDELLMLFRESESPIVVRGLAREWPIVKNARLSNDKLSSYLLGFYSGSPVRAMVCSPEEKGRFFYR